jgi:uncharacterized protein YcbK (DUF882 family)
MNLGATVTRRKLVEGGLLVLAATFLPGAALAAETLGFESPTPETGRGSVAVSGPAPRRHEPGRALSFLNFHTHESLTTVYFDNGKYSPAALRQVNYFFRDFRNNEVKPIDPHLLDLLYRIHDALKTEAPFELISGYRSPATNAWLASHSEGVSHHSLHMQGRAADINVRGCELKVIQSVALAMRSGGVGYYPGSDFVHVDTGRVRHWSCCGTTGPG